MKCEIIDGKFHIEAGTPTEQWALDQIIGSMSRYDDPNGYIVDAKVKKQQIAPASTPAPALTDAEIDDIFGPKS